MPSSDNLIIQRKTLDIGRPPLDQPYKRLHNSKILYLPSGFAINLLSNRARGLEKVYEGVPAEMYATVVSNFVPDLIFNASHSSTISGRSKGEETMGSSNCS